MPPHNRPAIQNATRILIALLGLCCAWVVYSYGMFNRVVPTGSDFATVAHCGAGPRAARVKPMIENNASFFCQIAPGRWIKTPYGVGPVFLAISIFLASIFGALYRISSVRCAMRSGAGAIMLFLVVFGIPMTLLGIQLNFIEGTLTLAGALNSSIVAVVAAGIVGFLVRQTYVRRFPSNRGGRPTR